jgi:hypothetical protein
MHRLLLILSSATYRAPDLMAAARELGVDDQGVMTAALAAERLGLPHNPPLAVARTRDKAACAPLTPH